MGPTFPTHPSAASLEESILESPMASTPPLQDAITDQHLGTQTPHDHVDEQDLGAHVDVVPVETITMKEAFERIGFGWIQIRVLLICGLAFGSDSIEVGLLSFLQLEAKEEFGLTAKQESTLSAVVFLGELVGALLWGPLADIYGRKLCSFLTALTVTVAAIASAFSPNYLTLVALRGIAGIGIGGLGVPFDLLAEFTPTAMRGKILVGIEFFWTFGTILVNFLAWALLDRAGWRVLVGLCAIPVALATVAFPFLPESPHWLLLKGRSRDAQKVFVKAAKLNGKPEAITDTTTIVLEEDEPAEHVEMSDLSATSGSSVTPQLAWQVSPSPDEGEEAVSRGAIRSDADASVAGVDGHDHASAEEKHKLELELAEVQLQDYTAASTSTDEEDVISLLSTEPKHKLEGPLALFRPGLRLTTFLLLLVWACFGFSYYGTVLVAPLVFDRPRSNHSSMAPTTTPTTTSNPLMSTTTTPSSFADSVSSTAYMSTLAPEPPVEFDYSALFIAGASELAACILALVLIDRVGRKKLSGFSYLISGLTMLLLAVPNMPRGLQILVLVIARAAIFIGSTVTWVVTPELLPTAVRGAGHSWSNAAARIAAFATPYWGDSQAIPLPVRVGFYGVISLVASAGSFFFPHETLGMDLD
eukprot:m.60408 g.60408  ORF g.60408 m.60408 type:complete len:644 (-) comp11815_c0_seq1:201-2132(-)